MTKVKAADEIDAEITRLLRLKSELFPEHATSLLEAYRQRSMLTPEEAEAITWVIALLRSTFEKYATSDRYRNMRKTLEGLLETRK